MTNARKFHFEGVTLTVTPLTHHTVSGVTIHDILLKRADVSVPGDIERRVQAAMRIIEKRYVGKCFQEWLCYDEDRPTLLERAKDEPQAQIQNLGDPDKLKTKFTTELEARGYFSPTGRLYSALAEQFLPSRYVKNDARLTAGMHPAHGMPYGVFPKPLKRGDRVIYLGPYTGSAEPLITGDQGIVQQVYGTWAWVHFDGHENYSNVGLRYLIRSVPAEPKPDYVPKVGDRVRYTIDRMTPGWPEKGALGSVQKVIGKTAYVSFDGIPGVFTVGNDHLEFVAFGVHRAIDGLQKLVVQAERLDAAFQDAQSFIAERMTSYAVTPPLKVDDRVKLVTRPTRFRDWPAVGDEGIVRKVFVSKRRVMVKFSGFQRLHVVRFDDVKVVPWARPIAEQARQQGKTAARIDVTTENAERLIAASIAGVVADLRTKTGCKVRGVGVELINDDIGLEAIVKITYR